MLMMTGLVTDRIGSRAILSIKQSVTIDTMLNFDGDSDGHGDGKCKETLKYEGWSPTSHAKIQIGNETEAWIIFHLLNKEILLHYHARSCYSFPEKEILHSYHYGTYYFHLSFPYNAAPIYNRESTVFN